MNASFEDDPPPQLRAPYLRPRDAASLVLARRRRDGFEVLLGQRAKGSVFYPDKWVFPGGRLERGDSRAPAAAEPAAEAIAKLQAGKPSRRPPRAFPLAAIRETFEETGLVLGRAGADLARFPPDWRHYAAQDAAPELNKLAFLARAITPPGRPRRFDARFFLARAEETLLHDRPAETDQELLSTRWFSLEDAAQLDLPRITLHVLNEAAARLAEGPARAPFFLRFERGASRLDRL